MYIFMSPREFTRMKEYNLLFMKMWKQERWVTEFSYWVFLTQKCQQKVRLNGDCSFWSRQKKNILQERKWQKMTKRNPNEESMNEI